MLSDLDIAIIAIWSGYCNCCLILLLLFIASAIDDVTIAIAASALLRLLWEYCFYCLILLMLFKTAIAVSTIAIAASVLLRLLLGLLILLFAITSAEAV